MKETLLEEIERLHDLEKYQEIIDLIEALPAERLNTELMGELGRAYNNIEEYEKALEILKTISIYRFIMPETYLRYGGGRIKLGDYVKAGLRCGINSALTGNFLTTTGTTIEKDKKMIEELGYEL